MSAATRKGETTFNLERLDELTDEDRGQQQIGQ